MYGFRMNENGCGVSILKKVSTLNSASKCYLLVTLTTIDKKRHLETLREKSKVIGLVNWTNEKFLLYWGDTVVTIHKQ